MERYKVCTKCGRSLLATKEFFFAQSRGMFGLSSSCKDCRKKAQKEYRANNYEKVLAQKKRYRDNNREKCRESTRRFHEAHQAEERERQRKYREEHPEARSKSSRKYRTQHLDQYAIYAHKRRAAKKRLENNLTPEEWESAKSEFMNKCAYCGKSGKLTQDHFIAISNGGGFTKSNIVPACVHCNTSKNKNDFFNWYIAQPFYSEEREKHILNYIEKEKAQ